MDLFRNITRMFFRGGITDKIIENYLEIQVKIEEIDSILTPFTYKYREYVGDKRKGKKDYETDFILRIFRRIKGLFGEIFDEKYLKYVETKDTMNTSEEALVIDYQKRLIAILDLFIKEIEEMRDFNSHPKRVDLGSLKNQLEVIFEEENKLVKLDRKIEEKVIALVKKIYAKRKRIVLDVSGSRREIEYYCDEGLRSLMLLQNIPLLQLGGLRKRSHYRLRLHKDDTIPEIPHYNLLLNDGEVNVHVIPKEYKESFLKLAA